MWKVRKHKTLVLACVLALCLLTLHWFYQYSNVLDLPIYFISLMTKAMPLTLHCNLGRLGNQMCTYATLYGISALNNRSSVSLSCNVKHLKDIFVGPSKTPTINEDLYIKRNPWNILPYLKPEDKAIPLTSNYIKGYLYPCSYTFFDHVKDDIRKEFRFHDHLVTYAQNVLKKANVKNLSDVTYVAIHVRRGDYQKHWLEVFEGVPVNMEYFEKALGYFREKYKNVIFVALSDDREWCRKNLAAKFGAYVPEEAPSPAHDLAIIANCNHTILSYGTFGFWGAYLAGGEVLYFDRFLKPNTTFTKTEFVFEKMYPPYWKGIVTVDASQWEQSATTDTTQNITTKR